MMRRCTLFLLFLGFQTFGQGPANNWYFGNNAAITFETSPPSAVRGSSLATLEGCSSISTEDGDLLFYTDGTTVYKKNGGVMTNGTGLLGNPTSTQSAIIIPKPLSDKIFYIFTVDVLRQERRNGPLVTDGVNYSIVDYTDNPEGEITEKNIKLLDYSAEKLSAVIKGCESDTVWMVTLSSTTASIPTTEAGLQLNTFYAYALTPDGIERTPVTSRLNLDITDVRGNLKFSPDGKKLACANVVDGLYAMDFNSLDGTVSNPKFLKVDTPLDFTSSYGVEFSPNNRFLYATIYNELNIIESTAKDFKSYLIQFDLENVDVVNSQIIIDEQQLYRGSLQLGPDGKIYRSMSATYFIGLPYLSVIDNPNALGAAADYRDRAISLGNGLSTQGLPPFNQSLFNRVDVINNTLSTTTLDLCDDEDYTLEYKKVAGATYRWFKDGVALKGETTSELDIAYDGTSTLPHKDIYELRLDLNDGTCARKGVAQVTFYKRPEQPATTPVLTQCEDSETADGFSIFNLREFERFVAAPEDGYTFTYFDNRLDAANNAFAKAIAPLGYENKAAMETLYARVASAPGCSIVVAFDIRVGSTQAQNASLETCDVDENGLALFDLTLANAQLLGGQPGNINIAYYLTEHGALLKTEEEKLPARYTTIEPYEQTVYARLESNLNCYAISKIALKINELPAFALPDDVIYCENLFPAQITVVPELDLEPAIPYTYLWMPTGQITPTLTTNLTGDHTLTITNTITRCSNTKMLTIAERGLAIIGDIEVMDVSSNNTATINYTGKGDYELALEPNGPYRDENLFQALAPGFYTVYVRSKDGCGTVSKDFSVLGFDKYFTPNADGVHDYWQVRGINAQIQPGTRITIFDRQGKLLKMLDPLSQGWDGTYGGEPLPSSAYWFHVVLEDGRVFKGHFLLKR